MKLGLPKFKIETEVNMEEAFLEAIGVPANVVYSKLSAQRLSRLGVVQKTYLDINEYGAEGAAATASYLISFSGFESGTTEYTPFTVDRPFVYVIHNTTTGSILMAGLVNNL